MPPLVSVIIPSYNCQQYIAETIACVLAQDYPAIELIVVDDGSSDQTLPIIQTFGDRLKLIQQQNTGVCAARNRGIQEASGVFLCLLDHDDYWFPDKLSRQVNALLNNPEYGVVYSSFTHWHANAGGEFPKPSDFKVNPSDAIDPEFSGWIYHLLLLDCWMLTSTALFRKDVFARCGLFDEALPYSEDWDLWLRLSRVYPFIKLAYPTTLYRQHAQQGNKKIRAIDYRTVLLTGAKKKWGLCSPDGRCLSNWQFRRQLARYHAAFALHHLQYARCSVPCVIAPLLKAWFLFPIKIKYLAYIIAGLIGWKPRY